MTSALREHDIRPAELMARKAWAVEHDRAFLLDRSADWAHARCPACDADAPALVGRKNGFHYQRCGACETVYTSPRPSAALLEAFYRQSRNYAVWNELIFPATEDARRERLFRPRAERLGALLNAHAAPGAAHNAPEGRTGEPARRVLLEVGAAFGTFCEAARQAGLAERIIALEPTPDLAATCRRRGFETIERPLEALDDESLADVVCAFEVIEHVHEPRVFVERCARLLRPGGLLVLSCPNVRGLDLAVLGLASGSFDHEHLNYFHPQSLATLVERCGLRTVETLTPGQLDCDILAQRVDAGELDLAGVPLLEECLVRRRELMPQLQAFLAANGLSSHLWLVARKDARR